MTEWRQTRIGPTRVEPLYLPAEDAEKDDAYSRFVAGIWRMTKLIAFRPTLSIGEAIGLLALNAYPPAWWLSVPLVLAWLVWRDNRRDSDTHAKHGDKGTLGSASGE